MKYDDVNERKKINGIFNKLNEKKMNRIVATPLLEECEDDTHTPKMGT
jgi:hypothetical protein